MLFLVKILSKYACLQKFLKKYIADFQLYKCDVLSCLS